MYTLYLAWIYAKSRLVNYIAAGTVAICVLTQVVVMAVLDGMLEDTRLRIQGLGEQVRVYLPPDGRNRAVFDAVAARIKALPEVREVTPVLQSYAVLANDYDSKPVIVRAIDLERESAVGSLGKFVLDQKTPSWVAPGVNAPDPTRPGIIIGDGLADWLSVGPLTGGLQELSLVYTHAESDTTQRQKLCVASRFRSSIWLYDKYYCYIPLELGQKLFEPKAPGAVSMASVWLKDPAMYGDKLEDLKQKIWVETAKACVPQCKREAYVESSEDMWADTFAGMAHENALMEVVMAFISLACGFAIFAILYTFVASRIRDIGVLRCIGAGRSGVVLIFVVSGLIIGLVGAVSGAIGGVYLSPQIGGIYEWFTGEPLYPPHLFGATELHILIDYNKLVMRTVMATLIAVLASIPAALWAGLKTPLAALRHE